MPYWKNKTIMMCLMLTQLTACGSNGLSLAAGVPQPLVPTASELVVLRTIPSFYIKYTNQQLDLRAYHEHQAIDFYNTAKHTNSQGKYVGPGSIEYRNQILISDKLSGY